MLACDRFGVWRAGELVAAGGAGAEDYELVFRSQCCLVASADVFQGCVIICRSGHVQYGVSVA